MRTRLILCLYLICTLGVGIYACKRPVYNWDMLAYMAVAIGYDHSDPVFVHDTVYHIAEQQLPPAVYVQLTDGGIEFRRRMAGNAVAFQGQLPFYVVKPLYTRLIYYLYKAGVPIIPATVFPSFISYFLISLLLILWLIRYLSVFLAAAVSGLIMLTAPIWEIARSSSPDGLSALLLLAALYGMIERKSVSFTFLMLLLSVFARLDNMIPAIFFLSLMCFYTKWIPRLSPAKYGWMLPILFVSYFFISFSTRAYGWNILYYPTFSKALNLSYTFHAGFQFRAYLALAISHLMTGLFFSNLFLFGVLALLVFGGASVSRIRKWNADQLLIGVIGLIISVRFILQPVITDRFYVAYYLCILVLLIRKLNPSRRPPEPCRS